MLRTRPPPLLPTALVPAGQGKAAKQRRALDLKLKAERAALREGPPLPERPMVRLVELQSVPEGMVHLERPVLRHRERPWAMLGRFLLAR